MSVMNIELNKDVGPRGARTEPATSNNREMQMVRACGGKRVVYRS